MAATFMGTFWSELLAFCGVLAFVGGPVLYVLWLLVQRQFARFFVTSAAMRAAVEAQDDKHRANIDAMSAVENRVEGVEKRMERLADRHDMRNLLQRQDALSAEQTATKVQLVALGGKMDALRENSDATRNIMSLVLEQMLQRDKGAPA